LISDLDFWLDAVFIIERKASKDEFVLDEALAPQGIPVVALIRVDYFFAESFLAKLGARLDSLTFVEPAWIAKTTHIALQLG
jgi:hypothetical protein